MNASDLVGKIAIRTEPTKRIGDRSYMTEPLLITKVEIDQNDTCTRVHVQFLGEGFSKKGTNHILGSDWLEGWAKYKKADEYIVVKKDDSEGLKALLHLLIDKVF